MLQSNVPCIEALLYQLGRRFLEDLTPEDAFHVWTANASISLLCTPLRIVAAFAQTRQALPTASGNPWSLRQWVVAWKGCVDALSWESSFMCDCSDEESDGSTQQRPAGREAGRAGAGPGLCACSRRVHQRYGNLALQAIWAHAAEVVVEDAYLPEESFSVNAASVAPFVEHAFDTALSDRAGDFLLRMAADSGLAYDLPLEGIRLMYILSVTGEIGVDRVNNSACMAVSAPCGVSDGSFALVVTFYELDHEQRAKATVYIGSSPGAALDLSRFDGSVHCHNYPPDVSLLHPRPSLPGVDMCIDSGGRIIIQLMQRPSVPGYRHGPPLDHIWLDGGLRPIQFRAQMNLLHKLSVLEINETLLQNSEVSRLFRLADDNNAYTHQYFFERYGRDQAERRWEAAWPATSR